MRRLDVERRRRATASVRDRTRRSNVLPALALGVLVLALGGCGAGATPEVKAPAAGKSKVAPGSPFAEFERAVREGDYAGAARLLDDGRAQNPEKARHLEADLALTTGRYEEVATILEGDDSAEAALLRARALRHVGSVDEALSVLETARTKLGATRTDAAKEPPTDSAKKGNDQAAKHRALLSALELDLMRGQILLEKGDRKTAEPVLLALVERANRGDIDELPTAQRAKGWGLVGRAAHLLRSPTDANDAFNQSETLADGDVPLLVARAELFLEKFDFAHAEEVLTDASRLAPHDPEVLLQKAHLLLESALAFAEVEDIARSILRTNPRHTGARFLLAGVALRTLDLRAADRHVAAGLKTNPRDLELLSMGAAVRFLAEDPAGFEKATDHVLSLNPTYAELFRIVGDYAEWEHRYPDIERLMRRAVRLDREDGRARALLGLTLVRSGSDAAGVLELRRAFELDPFNVRVLNTLDLYEKLIPQNYVDVERGPFRYRFPKDEAKLLERYVPALLDQAYEEMRERYAFTPKAPIGIEIYGSREEFSVRTSGLPSIAIQGVCFGQKLATMSPIGAPGNLGMTLWHELAHVFHIGLSENRVPRWLTEGMAEWETKRRKVGWSREMDLELYRALHDDSLPHLDSMSRAFTHARRMEDIGTAYYASGEIASWFAETKGSEKGPQMLRELGEKRLPDDVVPEVLGAPLTELDREFRAWASENVARFDGQFVSLVVRQSAEELRAAWKKAPNDQDLQTRLAIAELQEGDVGGAEKRLEKILTNGFHPQAAFFRARLFLAKEQKGEAKKLLSRLAAEKHDGFEIQMMLGRLALAEGALEKAEEHLERATLLDGRSEEPWSLLAALALKKGDRSAELSYVRKWAELSEHEVVVHRRLLELLIEGEKYDEARRAGELAVWVDLAGMESHRLYGLALARSGDLKKAEFEWESALLCPGSPPDVLQLAATWKDELTRAGQKAKAATIDAHVARSATSVVRPPATP